MPEIRREIERLRCLRDIEVSEVMGGIDFGS
jgi:hypothetical protein